MKLKKNIMNIDISYFNIYNYFSGKKKIKYNDINKYSGATYELDYDIIWTNYKKDNKLIIKDINVISLYIPYEKLILCDDRFKNKKIIDNIFISLNNICDSKISCTFNIGFWKSIIDKTIVKDVILKLTQKSTYIDETSIKKYIKIAKQLKKLFNEELISLEINNSLFLI